MNKYVKAAGGGIVGGLIGAAVWGGITYATHREIGWIAWGIGALVGFGVRLVARDDDGVNYGMMAVAIAFLSIVAGKYLAVALIVDDAQKELGKIQIVVTDDDMISEKADEVATEWRAKGKQPFANANANALDMMKKNYVPAVTAEAKKRWLAVPAAERQQLIAAEQAKVKAMVEGIGGMARKRGFADSFRPIDALWFILAGITAFKLGSGMASE